LQAKSRPKYFEKEQKKQKNAADIKMKIKSQNAKTMHALWFKQLNGRVDLTEDRSLRKQQVHFTSLLLFILIFLLPFYFIMFNILNLFIS